jgi:hypothetical protein
MAYALPVSSISLTSPSLTPHAPRTSQELFGGRGKFSITVSVAKSQGSDVRWKNLKFQVMCARSLVRVVCRVCTHL